MIKFNGKLIFLGGMFRGCNKLIKIEGVLENNAKDFCFMFYECRSLQNIDGLKEWDVKKVTNFYRMFHDSNNLQIYFFLLYLYSSSFSLFLVMLLCLLLILMECLLIVLN